MLCRRGRRDALPRAVAPHLRCYREGGGRLIIIIIITIIMINKHSSNSNSNHNSNSNSSNNNDDQNTSNSVVCSVDALHAGE